MKTKQQFGEQYPEMTNEEYRAEINRSLKEVKDNRLLRYFYIITKDIICECEKG